MEYDAYRRERRACRTQAERSSAWKARVAASKFSKYPHYGLAQRGYLGIQGDHDGALAVRNIRIRELP